MDVPKPDGENIAADLERESRLYREMLEISKKTLEGVRAGDGEAAAAAVKAKQDILRLLDEVEARLRPVRADWRQISAAISEADRRRFEETMREIQAVLEEIIEVENEVQRQIEARRGRVIEKLRGVQGQKNLKRAYGQKQDGDSTRFLDERT